MLDLEIFSFSKQLKNYQLWSLSQSVISNYVALCPGGGVHTTTTTQFLEQLSLLFNDLLLFVDMQRCENVILDNLPFGFVSLKSKAQIQVERDQDYTQEYKTPIGGSVGLQR